MIDELLTYIAPHYCYGCGKLGQALCENCKYNIMSESYGRCIVCDQPAGALMALCKFCQVPYQRAWCVGERSGEIERLISAFKFQNVRAAYKPLAELLDHTLPELPPTTIIVPVPTIPSHIRQRGYDHTLLIARHLARRRQLSLYSVLERVSNTKQRGAGRAQRFEQAKVAFTSHAQLDSDLPYLLIDDVVTTGATFTYAAETLKLAGAQTIWAATVSRQPSLDA